MIIGDALQELKNDILSRLGQVRGDAQINALLTALISDIDAMSADRLDYREILARMFWRLNHDENGVPIADPYDERQSSPAFNVMAPIAQSLTELAIHIEVMRRQVNVYTATGGDLDTAGRDYDMPRQAATRAVRIGYTRDGAGNAADFPAGRIFSTRENHSPLRFEILHSDGGDARFRCMEYGDIGNAYYGELSPATPVSGFGRAVITGTAIPGQNEESDEQYRRRLLRHLRRVAFGGNVAQYQQELQGIDGVGDAMIFPVWRGEGTVKVSVVDGSNHPVTPEFETHVNNIIDPPARSGTGFGIAPVGHRVTVSTPEWLDINVNIRAVPAQGITSGQITRRLNEILEQHFAALRQSVIDEWERTYFSGEGIANAYADAGSPEWFAAAAAMQTHTFYTVIQPQILGVALLETRLVSAVDFENILINGQNDPSGFRIEQTQETQYLPRLNNADIEIVDYIAPSPPTPPIPPGDIVRKFYNTGFDMPVSRLSEVTNDG